MQSLPANSIMATADVTSLYTNSLHPSALEHLLNKRPPHSLLYTQFLIQLTQLTLTHSHFSFDTQHYFQVKETGMTPSLCHTVHAFP